MIHLYNNKLIRFVSKIIKLVNKIGDMFGFLRPGKHRFGCPWMKREVGHEVRSFLIISPLSTRSVKVACCHWWAWPQWLSIMGFCVKMISRRKRQFVFPADHLERLIVLFASSSCEVWKRLVYSWDIADKSPQVVSRKIKLFQRPIWDPEPLSWEQWKNFDPVFTDPKTPSPPNWGPAAPVLPKHSFRGCSVSLRNRNGFNGSICSTLSGNSKSGEVGLANLTPDHNKSSCPDLILSYYPSGV